MHRIIKIHIDNWVILLGDATANLEFNFEAVACQASEFENLVSTIFADGKNVFIETNDASKFILDVSQTMKYSVACGGFVQNKNQEILFIYRRKKWDLPKGKLDKGETLAACALREVQEETGAKNLIINELRTETFHVFLHKEKHILKHTYWYNMQSNDIDFTPQLEEEIEQVCWIEMQEVATCMQNSFASIQDVLDAN